MNRPYRLTALVAFALGLALPAAPALAQDVDPPVIEVLESGSPVADGALFAHAVTLTLQVTDASPTTVDATLDGAAYTSGTLVSGEGSHELAVTATDDAGNVATLSRGFEIDTVAPVFGPVLPAAGTLTAAAEVTLQGQVTGAAAVTVDGSPANLVGGDFTAGPFALAEGERTWTLVATDAAGNSAQLSHRVVRDSTPPAVSIDQPAAGALQGASPVDVVGSASDPHLESVTVNGTAAARTGSTFLARNVPLAEGSNTVVAEAGDAAGNTGQASRVLVLDTQPPVLAITDPAAGTVVPAGTLALSGTASDPHLDRVEVEGVAATLQVTGSTGTWTGTASLAEGPNVLHVEAFDRLGWSASTSVTVIRDTTAPAVQVTSPADGAYLQGDTVSVAGTVAQESGLTVTVNGVAATVDAAASPATFSAPDVPLVEGENRLIARATDAVGNQGAHSRVVYRDTVAPAFEAVDPGDGALAVPPESRFEVTFSEPLGTLPAGAWRLELADGQAIAAQASVDGEVLTVQPDAPMPSKAEVHLVLTTGIVDRAGNALAAERTLTFQTKDVVAPAAPALSATPPAYLCASELALSGTAEAEAVVEVTGGAAGGSTRADAAGAFTLVVELAAGTLNHLELTAVDVDGNRSDPLAIDVAQDCAGPRVVAASLAGDVVSIAFDEPVDGATLDAGTVTLTAASGPVAGTVAVTVDGAGATFTADAALPAEPVRLDVSQGVRDLAGNPLAFPYTEIFGASVTPSFVAGRVIDSATGRPLAGASAVVDSTDGVVYAEPQPEQTTGSDGRFRIPVAAGTHYLVFLRPGYTPAFRILASASGVGADVFDPRLTPAAAAQTIAAASGGNLGGEDGLALSIPPGSLSAEAETAVTALDEQALPAPLPYGWSPRGAAWVDLGGADLSSPATLDLPVDAADGVSLALIRLDLTTLQWHVEAVDVAAGGIVTVPVDGEGAFAAVEADHPQDGSLAPPAPVAGTVLGSAPAPVGTEVSAATVTFDPSVVLPSQRSRASAEYTLASEVPSGLALTVLVHEELTLLDGTVRTAAPYEADLVLYHAGDGTPGSRFDLVPSALARSVPFEMGAEDVTVRPYAGETVQGNVLGPTGGTVATPEGDRVDLPAGSLSEPTAVLLARAAEADLATPVPAGTEFLGALDLDLSGRVLAAPAALTLELGAAPAAGESGLLFQVVDLAGLGSGPLYRPVAALAATASGWTTAPIDPVDLPWPGVREAGRYVFLRLTSPVGFLRGTVFGVGGAPARGALVTAASGAGAVAWVQVSSDLDSGAGDYVMPVPVAAVTATGRNLATGDLGAAGATVSAADERVDLDLFLQLTVPQVVEVQPPDGTLEVPPGVEPTVTFSEAVDPTSVAAGVQLYDGATLVPVTVEVQGALVRLRPQATLRPGALHEVRVNTAVRDLQGNRVAAAVTSTFTTRDDTANEQLDLTRVHLFEPDAAGDARVLGRAGAVPADSVVFVENLSRLVSTPTVIAAADGGFETTIETALTDRLLLHVVIPGQNEVVLELTPFLTADGQGAHVEGDTAAEFTTLDGITVSVEAGTFDRPTVVRAVPRALGTAPAPMPEGILALYAFDLDFGGADAKGPLQITLPAPAGTPDVPDDSTERLMLAHAESILGEPRWMVYDLLRQVGSTLTTAPPPATGSQALFRVPAGSGEPVGRFASLGGPAGLAGLTPTLGPALAPAAYSPVAAPSRLGDQKEYLAGAVNPGLYTVMYTNQFYDFVAVPLAGPYAYFQGVQADAFVAVVNGIIGQLLEYDAVLMATRRGETVEVEARDLRTGYKLFDITADPPEEGGVLVLPPDPSWDSETPAPVTGSPLRFFVVTPDAPGSRSLAPGIEYELSMDPQTQVDTLTVRGERAAASPDAQVRLLGLDDGVDATERSEGGSGASPGSFELSEEVTRGHRYLLAIGAEIASDRALEIGFSEGLDPAFPGIEVRDAAGRDVHPEVGGVGTTEIVRIRPRSGWLAGKTYTLKLGPELADAAGNTWDESLELEFRVQASAPRDTYELGGVRDVVRVGSLLFLAADTDGLVVLDASDPTDLKPWVSGPSGPVNFPFLFGDPVRGVTVDPHGRVLVVGGGVLAPGALKIFDPLAVDPVAMAADPDSWSTAFRGNTIVSDKTGGTGTNLPAGNPRRVAVLSDDQSDSWKIGSESPPSGLVVDPAVPPVGQTEWDATVSGLGALSTPNRPVTLRDLARGTWNRVDTDAGGHFSVTLHVRMGDQVELLRNRQSIAYVATLGVGIEVVDVNAFWNEAPEEPNDIQSDVLEIYTGNDDPSLRLCGEPVLDIASATLDLGTLFDGSVGHPHPLTVVGLMGFRGLALFESDPQDVGNFSFFNETCLSIDGSARVSGLTVLEDYRFDLDDDGELEEEEERDYLVVAHLTAGVLILDATNRDAIELVGRIRLPGAAVHLGVDREGRRLYVAGSGAGLYVVDLDRPPKTELIDEDGDGQDDRILETVELTGASASAPVLLVPELGVAYAGGLEGGLTSVTVGEPRLLALAENEADPGSGAPPETRWRQVTRLAPFGVPTAPESGEAGAPKLAGSFRVLAYLPGASGPEVRLDVASLGPGGVEIEGAGDPEAIADLPKTVLEGDTGLVLRRLSDSPLDEGYQIYLSEEVAALADLRAASAFDRTSREDDQCERCELPDGARELLSGNTVAVRFSDSARATLGPLYGDTRLDGAELELASVPWELSPSTRQEPTLNPSYGDLSGRGDAAPGTLLHSGEYSHAATDLMVKSRGFDFAFTRTYRSQTVGAGPLGPGWDFAYHQRLRELPNGDVESYDGRGRREVFTKKAGEDGSFEAPPGRFVELSRTSAGWVWIDAQKNQMRFDRFGRLVAIADAVKDSEDTGNEMRFRYDAAGRLVEIEDTLERSYFLAYDEEGRLTTLTDFDGREVTYEYDPDGRLVRVLSPEVTSGIESPGRLTTTYAYEPGTGALATALTTRDNLTSITDARGVEWLANTYTDADGDGRADEVTSQTWGGDALSIAYDLAARTAAVTDREGGLWSYQHDADGHPTQATDPASAVTALAYDAEGLVTSVTEPLGRVTTTTYDTAGGRRSRSNATAITVTADGRGPNGSAASLTTAITYDPRTNLPATVTDPRGAVTTYTRTAAGLPTTIARPEGATTAIEYNAFGQVTKVTNPNGHATSYAYFGSGESEGYLRQEVVDPGGLGLTTRYEVDPRGNVTAVTDPRGTRHTTDYNELDWMVEETAAAGSLNYTTTYSFDAAGQVTEVVAPYGLGTETFATRTTYGPLGEVLSVAREIRPGTTSATTTYAYDKNRNPTRVTDPNGHVTELAYDARNFVESRTAGKGTADEVTESFTYDAEGRLLTTTDGRMNVWTREHDGYGRLAAAIDPLGNRTETEYDDGGNVSETRSKGAGETLLAKSTAFYDFLGRTAARTRYLWTDDSGSASLLATTWSYDPAGNVLSVTGPRAHRTTFTYDAAERQITRTDAMGNQVAYQMDEGGQPEAVTLIEVIAGGGGATTTTTHEYDALGREIASADPLGNTTRRVLDAQGHAQLVVDPEGHQTERVYDSLGRMLTETLPEGIRTEMTYDAKGNRTSYRDALGNTTTWAYDALDRVKSVQYPDATTETTAYDGSGNPVTITQPSGTVVVQAFDAANRLTSRIVTPVAGVEGPTSETFAYDGLDRLTQAISGTGPSAITSSRTYDSLSRMTSEGTAGRTVSYSLDDAGNVTGLTYPSGLVIGRTIDALDRVEAIAGVAGYGYRGPDLVAQKSVGALSETVGYDGARRPKSRAATATGGGIVYSETMAWSPRSLLRAQSRRALNDTAFQMAHDGAGRLKSRSHVGQLTADPGALATGATTLIYDAAQNLVEEQTASTENPPQRKPMPVGTQNRPMSIDGVPLTWDANGNLTAKGNLRFHYDWRNRLTRVDLAEGTELATYAYDAFNRLVSRTAGGTTETTAWSGWQPVETYEVGQLAERRTFGLGLDELVRLEIDLDGDGSLEQSYTPLYDQVGNLVALAGSAGEIVERYEYSPYGFRIAAVDSIPPEIQQLLYRDGALHVQMSEEILRAVLAPETSAQGQVTSEGLTAQPAASTDPPPVSFTVTATSESIPVTVTFPEELGRYAFRRAVISPTGTAPAAGTEVTLRIEAAGLQDLFFNEPGAAFEQTFAWPGSEAVLQDSAAPQVEEVLTRDGRLEIGFSEQVDLTAAAAAITIDGATVAWELDATGYRLQAVDPLASTAETLTIGTGVQDLAGTALASALTVDLTAPIATADPEPEPQAATAAATLEPRSLAFGAPGVIFFRLDEAGRLLTSVTGNRFGFHGRELDFATGLVYFRNRWYDPQLGRFLQPDPLGYADGPSLYQYALNNPASFSDPLGLATWAIGEWSIEVPDALDAKVKLEAGRISGAVGEIYNQAHGIYEMSQRPGGVLGQLALDYGLEAKYLFGIAIRLARACGTRSYELFADTCSAEQDLVTRELASHLWERSRSLPVAHSVDAGIEVFRAETTFDQGFAEGKLAVRVVEDILAIIGLRAAWAEGAAVPRGPVLRSGSLPEGGTPIYRGIPRGHHAWDDALRGTARPGDLAGHSDPVLHNLGQTSTSRLTSWTHSRAVAERYAGADGLVLEWRTGLPPEGAGWRFLYSPDKFYEQEVLVEGLLRGARVTRP